MLEAFQSLREELTTKRRTEVDQTSVSASKLGPSSSAVVNLDLPLRDNLGLPQMLNRWKWTVVLHFHLTLGLIIMWYRISLLVQPRSLLRRLQLDLKNILTGSMTLIRGLPQINTLMSPMNLGLHVLNPKNMLTRVSIR